MTGVLELQSSMRSFANLLSRFTFNTACETDCQNTIETICKQYSIPYEREWNTGAGFCDFFLPRSGILIEVKAMKSWSKVEVYRQCERYLKSPESTGLILATGKTQGLPSLINNKPTLIHSLGMGSL